MDKVPVPDLTEALLLYDIDAQYEVLNAKRRVYLENKYKGLIAGPKYL